MKLALLGGTFNPLHNGHINLANLIRREFFYDKILFVPSYIPAHKELSGDVPADERLHMLKLSLESLDWAIYSDCEIQRKGVSYTVDTLEYVKEQYDIEGKPGLVIGDDLATGFKSWRNTNRILELADLIVAHRLYTEEVSLDFPHKYAHNEIFTMSSTEIRDKLLSREDIDSVIPAPAARYIIEKGLYIGD